MVPPGGGGDEITIFLVEWEFWAWSVVFGWCDTIEEVEVEDETADAIGGSASEWIIGGEFITVGPEKNEAFPEAVEVAIEFDW